MPHQVKLVAVLKAKPGQEAALKMLLDGMIGPSRSEAGNLRYDLWKDPAEPGRYLLDELYRDASAVAAHRESPHFRYYLSTINALAERTVFTVEPIDIS